MKNGLPIVVPANQGEHISVLGNRIDIKLSSGQTGGASFLFENTTLPGDGVPPHVHEREDEIIHILQGEL